MFKEFCRQTSANETDIKQRWMEIERQIFEYAPLEEKKVVKDLLVQYSASNEDNAGELACFGSYVHVYPADSIVEMTAMVIVLLFYFYRSNYYLCYFTPVSMLGTEEGKG